MSKKIHQSLSDIQSVSTTHNQGEKFVFLSAQDSETAITQFAFGRLSSGEYVEEHLHPTMEECFYFIEGEGEYIIGEKKYIIRPKDFFRIPANTKHALKVTSGESLTFVYFGVAV